MKRKSFAVIIIIAALALSVVTGACDGNGQRPAVLCTVSFQSNGGTAVNDISVEKGGSITLPECGKSGYNFEGWYESSDLSGEPLTSPYTPTGNITLYAKWTPAGPDTPVIPDNPDPPSVTYTISFQSNGGTIQPDMTAEEGGGIDLPRPQRYGYTFEGWYESSDLSGQPLASPYTPTGNITLYAKWRLNEGVFDSDCLTAIGFHEFSDPSVDEIYHDFDGKKIKRTMTSDALGTAGWTAYNLNDNIEIKDNYQIKWFEDAAFSQPIGMQKAQLTYADNIFFASVNDLSGRVTAAFLVNIYVWGDFVFSYYDTPYSFHEAFGTQPVKTVAVVENQTAQPYDLPSPAFKFKYWTDESGALFDFSAPAVGDAALFAAYESVTCTVDWGVGEAGTAVYIPYEKVEVTEWRDKENMIFDGFTAGGAGICDEYLAASMGAKNVGAEQVKRLKAVWLKYTQDHYFVFEQICEGGAAAAYSVFWAGKTLPQHGKVSVPDSHDGLPVTVIENLSDAAIKRLVIPESVTAIAPDALHGCGSLTELTLPFVGEGRKRAEDAYQYPLGYIFGTESFAGAAATWQSYHGDSVSALTQTRYYIPSKLEKITVSDADLLAGAFSGCENLKAISVGDNVSEINPSAFSGCTGLRDIVIDAANPNYRAADGCIIETDSKELIFGTKDAVIPADGSVTIIGQGAFKDCVGLTGITIPGTVAVVATNAFDGCADLTSMAIPESVKIIYHGAFKNCEGLKEVTLSGGLFAIAANAFENCRGLTNIVVPGTVSVIGPGAFGGCTGLTEITVPFAGEKPDGSGQKYFGRIFGATDYSNNNSFVPASLKKVTITGDTAIASNAFYGLSGITDITISDGVSSIGSDAFYGTGWYDSMPDGLVYAGKNAYKFKGTMPAGASVTVESGTLSISPSAFSGSAGLTAVQLPASVKTVGDFAFSGCTGLTSLDFPAGVTSIGADAFSGCSRLTSVTLPAALKTIGEWAFNGCEALESVYYEGGAADWCGISLGSPASNPLFYGADLYMDGAKVTRLIIAGPATGIPNDAFRGCGSLTELVVGEGVTSIGGYAFYGCLNLASIEIPAGVTNIGYGAFSKTAWYDSQPDGVIYAGKAAYGYKGVMPEDTAVALLSDTVLIADNAFAHCQSLISVSLPVSLTRIGAGAFRGCVNLKNITYGGTVSQWEAAAKGADWDEGIPSYTVICSDGSVVKPQT